VIMARGLIGGVRRLVRAVFPELEGGRSQRRLAGWVPSRAHVNTLIGASGKTVLNSLRQVSDGSLLEDLRG
jgi:hypothetical protein